MIMPGGVVRLQTLGGLAAQLFDSTLRTYIFRELTFTLIFYANCFAFLLYSTTYYPRLGEF